MEVKLVHRTEEAEKLIAYCARVSSPHQESPEIARLLAYCIKHKHWSIFEMATMCVEITTSRAIAQQILRHRSFHFQEFSQRYAEVTNAELYPARMQDNKNRQNSLDTCDEFTRDWFLQAQQDVIKHGFRDYERALSMGIAKEQARFLLPLSTTTKLYMHGTLRDWIHYLNLRSGNGTQKEHRDIAVGIQQVFASQFPVIAEALGWEYEKFVQEGFVATGVYDVK